MANIHPTALVDPQAELDEDVEVGPFCIVGPNVKIGSGTRLISQCQIIGNTVIGEKNTIHPTAVIGGEPQDLSYHPGTKSSLRIGNGNTFREGFTANPGSKDDTETVIGDNNLFMANTHIAHNAIIGNHVIMANGAMVAGFGEIGDRCLLSGMTAVHQFCRVGRLAVLSGVSAISVDLPPFMIGHGRNGPVQGINLIGLQRSGYSEQTIRALKNVYKIFFRSTNTVKNAIIKIREEVPQIPEVVEFIDFVEASKRGTLSAKNCNVRQY